jgi:hypothetical protein
MFDPEYIYIMSDSPAYKIGMSNNPEYRLRQIRGHNPRDVKIIYQFPCSTRDDAHTLEKTLHEKFKHKRIRNEWFSLNAVDLNKIKSTCELFYTNTNSYETITDWFAVESKNLFEKNSLGHFTPDFKMPKIKEFLPLEQKIIFDNSDWNAVFNKHYEKKTKLSLEYLQEKFNILKRKGTFETGNILHLADEKFIFERIFGTEGLKYDEELEELLHFFGNFEWYVRKHAFELLNFNNMKNEIPFMCHRSDERRFELTASITATISDLDLYVQDIIKEAFLFPPVWMPKKHRIKTNTPFFCLDFVRAYINYFWNSKTKIQVKWDDYTRYIPTQSNNYQRTRTKLNDPRFSHEVAGHQKFCTKGASKLYTEFLKEGFEKIHNIKFS